MNSLGRGAVLFAAIVSACLVAPALAGQSAAPFDTNEWKTDFSRHSVPWEEILSGGPPKDGIPAIDDPRFVTVEEADRWLGDREPVVAVQHAGVVRVYPWQILIWHEIVNDELARLPVSVTYCPLCNTAIAFDRRVGGRVLDFGTTGKLRHSDLVMYDRQTESWWQQATGEAIVGELTGTELTMLPAPTLAWRDVKGQLPGAEVLSRETGHDRDYGANPYRGYDRGKPFLFRGALDGRLEAMTRVVVAKVGGEAVAFPLPVLAEERIVHHEIGTTPVVVVHREGTASAVDDGKIARGRDVGAVAVYERAVRGRMLTFERDGDAYRDRETASRWTFLGEAVAGPLAGERLVPVVHYVPFWFAWAAFAPETPIYGR